MCLHAPAPPHPHPHVPCPPFNQSELFEHLAVTNPHPRTLALSVARTLAVLRRTPRGCRVPELDALLCIERVLVAVRTSAHEPHGRGRHRELGTYHRACARTPAKQYNQKKNQLPTAALAVAVAAHMYVRTCACIHVCMYVCTKVN